MACGHERLRTIAGICTVEIFSVLPDRLPPLALILVSAERARDFPQSLPLAANRGPVYLIGTALSVETLWSAHPSFPRKRESRAVRLQLLSLDPRFFAGVTIIRCRAAKPAPSSPGAIPPPAADCRSTPMAAVFPTCIWACTACTHCRRACARCAGQPRPGSPAPRSRSAMVRAACSPRQARSSCRTSALGLSGRSLTLHSLQSSHTISLSSLT
jgi:hypothetical protein